MTDTIRAALATLRSPSSWEVARREAIGALEQEIIRLEQAVEDAKAEIDRLTEENRRLLIVDRERCIQCGELGENEPCPVLAAECEAHAVTRSNRAELARECLHWRNAYPYSAYPHAVWVQSMQRAQLETWAKEE